MDIVAVIQQAEEAAAEGRAKVRPPGARWWKPASGVEFVVGPSVRCPWCRERVEVARVWAVDEHRKRMKEVWDEYGEKVRDETRWHPHAFVGDQRVCMGNATSVAQALCEGLNPDSPANGTVAEWMAEELGHRCGGVEEALDGGGGDYYCEECGDYFDEDEINFCEQRDVYYCQWCWAGTHSCCDHCAADVHVHGDEYTTTVVINAKGSVESWCDDCRSDEAFYCDECERNLVSGLFGESSDANEDRMCQECWAKVSFTCKECGEVKHTRDQFEDVEGNGTGWCQDCCFDCDKCENTCTPDELEANGANCKECQEEEQSDAAAED